MIIKAVFDDCDDFYFLNISLCNFGEIEKLQDEFFAWMFNKSNNHEYWVTVGTSKIGCAYGIEAFIKWMKKYHGVDINILGVCDDAFVPEIYF